MLSVGVDWTDVLNHALAQAAPVIAALGVIWVRLEQVRIAQWQRRLAEQQRELTAKMKTPSGEPVGKVIEETHALAATHTQHMIALERAANGGHDREPGPPAPEAAGG